MLGRLDQRHAFEGGTLEFAGIGTVNLRVYRPARHTGAAVLWIHGGGYLVGSPVQDHRLCASTCRKLGVVVVAVAYRLAPEHPCPAALDDCYAAWQWLQEAADRLGVDQRRVAVGGQSAGGGLAASLVQRIQDAGQYPAKAQWLFCPMLDDRTAARRELDTVNHPIWNNRANAIGWHAYLGQEPGAPGTPPYAVPARRDDLRELPQAWIGVGDLDLFLEECTVYARRLRDAGTEVRLEVAPGAPHGFESLAQNTRIAKSYVARAQEWLGRALEIHSSRTVEDA